MPNSVEIALLTASTTALTEEVVGQKNKLDLKVEVVIAQAAISVKNAAIAQNVIDTASEVLTDITANDVIKTNSNKVATNQDVIATNQDVTTTQANVNKTDADVITTVNNVNITQNNVELTNENAQTSTTNAQIAESVAVGLNEVMTWGDHNLEPYLKDLGESTLIKSESPAIGEVLIFNGTEWANTPVGESLPPQEGNAAKVLSTDGTGAIWIDALAGGQTKTPNITIEDIMENTSVTGIILDYDLNTTYNIIAEKGSISGKSIDKFNYKAPDILSGSSNITDTVMVYATKAGELKSNLTTLIVTVLYVPIIGDVAVVDNLTTAFTNTGWTL